MKFIAHRGFSRRFADNSLPAFQAVIDHPCNGRSLIGIELDVHFSADEKIPVMHETTIPGHDGKTIPVAQCTFEELRRLFKRKHGELAPPVPAIEEVLDLVGHRTELCFEIKKGPYDIHRFSRSFAAALSAYRPRGDVVVSSFSLEILDQVRPYLARLDLRYGYIIKTVRALQSLSPDLRKRFDLLHPGYKLVLDSPELFPSDGPPVRCWTVNSPKTVKRLIARMPAVPVEAIMTDDIDLAERFPETQIGVGPRQMIEKT
jgi:glycerophosphoryl diester phosphodiesterase